MSRCECSACEAAREYDRRAWLGEQVAIREGLARLGQAVAIWGAMAEARASAFIEGWYTGLDEYRRREVAEERQGRVIRAVSLWGALAMAQWSAYKLGHRDGALKVTAEWMAEAEATAELERWRP